MNTETAVQAIKSRHPVERWGLFQPQYCAAAKNGRPRDEARQMAREWGEKTFQGTGCRKCGHSERYTTNGSCVNCKRMKTKGRKK